MKSNKWIVLVAINVTLISFSGAIFAQSTADKETARQLFNEGISLRDNSHDDDGAQKKFQQAWQLVQTPIIGLELGRADVSLGRLIEAREILWAVKQLAPKPNESPASLKARAEAATLAESIAARVPNVAIFVKNAPQDASFTVKIDGETVTAASLAAPRNLNPGAHTIVFEQPGKQAQTNSFTLVESEKREVNFQYEVAPATTPSAAPSASETPIAVPSTAPSATTAALNDVPVVTSHAPSRGAHWLVWTGVGLAGVGVVSGLIFGGLTFSAKSSAQGACDYAGCQTGLQNDRNRAYTMATISTVSWIVAGFGGAISITAFVVGGATPGSNERASVAPFIGLGSLGLKGQF